MFKKYSKPKVVFALLSKWRDGYIRDSEISKVLTKVRADYKQSAQLLVTTWEREGILGRHTLRCVSMSP